MGGGAFGGGGSATPLNILRHRSCPKGKASDCHHGSASPAGGGGGPILGVEPNIFVLGVLFVVLFDVIMFDGISSVCVCVVCVCVCVCSIHIVVSSM